MRFCLPLWDADLTPAAIWWVEGCNCDGDIIWKISLCRKHYMTAELHAIRLALGIINDTQYSRFVVCWNSMSSIQSIDNYTENNFLIGRIIYQIQYQRENIGKYQRENILCGVKWNGNSLHISPKRLVLGSAFDDFCLCSLTLSKRLLNSSLNLIIRKSVNLIII